MSQKNFRAGLVTLFSVMALSASLFLTGCGAQEGQTQTDKEAAVNAAKAPDRSAAPSGSSKPGMKPPPP